MFVRLIAREGEVVVPCLLGWPILATFKYAVALHVCVQLTNKQGSTRTVELVCKRTENQKHIFVEKYNEKYGEHI